MPSDLFIFVCLMLNFKFTEGCLPLYFVLLFCWHVSSHLVLLKVSIMCVTFFLHRKTFSFIAIFSIPTARNLFFNEGFSWNVFSVLVLIHVYSVNN